MNKDFRQNKPPASMAPVFPAHPGGYVTPPPRRSHTRFFIVVTVGLSLVAIAALLFWPWYTSRGRQASQTTPTSQSTLLTPTNQGVQVTSTSQTTPTSQATQSALSSQIDSFFKNETARHRFSGSVLVERNDQVLLASGYGQANLSSGAANNPDTRFYMGSVTKEFTAAGILLLQERGKLSVNDHLCKFVAQCPASWANVTLHELLIHTSGIPDLDAFSLPRTSWSAWFASFDNRSLSFTAGSRFFYCNLCYKLLAYVVQVASGVPYAQFLQQTIFTPVQMSSTGFTGYYSKANIATGYATWGTPAVSLGLSLTQQWSWLQGSGLLYTTARDLSRWDKALYAYTVLSQASETQAFTSYVTADLFPNSKYGYGWFISPSPIAGHPLIWHDGVIDGFRNYLGRYIKDHITIIILSNLATTDIVGLAHSVQTLIYGH